MKVQDLKIGNWVQFRHTETPVLITLGDFVREYKEEHLEDYEPIPLTEEWLVKFGFEKNEFNSEKYGYGVEYVLETNGVDGFILVYQDDFSIGILGRKEDFGISPNIDLFRNVHQLQNLYFALTGQELQTDENMVLRKIGNTDFPPNRP